MTTTTSETLNDAKEKAWQEYWNILLTDYPATAQSIIRSGMLGLIKNGFIYGFHSGVNFAVQRVEETLK